jgi:hypothetical protein
MLKGFLIISVAYALFAFLQGLYKTGRPLCRKQPSLKSFDGSATTGSGAFPEPSPYHRFCRWSLISVPYADPKISFKEKPCC